MTLYETIFVRRSVRQYNENVIDSAAMTEIKDYLQISKQLFGKSARFEIAEKDAIKGGFAPYAILAHSDDGDEDRVNIGYTLQGMDLYLQSAGYGSIWCGMASPKKPEKDYRILLGFGNTDVSLRRSEDDFKRKRLSEISDADNTVARAARLAPSAVNFQPWKLEFGDKIVRIGANAHGIGKLLTGKIYMFDLGIITKHIEVALERDGKVITSIKTAGNTEKDFAIEVRYD